ncbi:hypothetical protein [Phaeobacter sp. C3_T13_0]|uniref:hypothetical protein n=1 Tax=Phaeobacter cretensis TaxID=3342641 RepID=UPI0039BD09E7
MNLVREIITRKPEHDDDVFADQNGEVLKEPRGETKYNINKYTDSNIIFADAQSWAEENSVDIRDVIFSSICCYFKGAGFLSRSTKAKSAASSGYPSD